MARRTPRPRRPRRKRRRRTPRPRRDTRVIPDAVVAAMVRDPMKWRAATLATLLMAFHAHAAPRAESVTACEICHGRGGNSTTPFTPSIAGQPPTFLENQLIFFREGLRASEVMQTIAMGMKDAEIVALARHFAKSRAKVVAAGRADAKLAARGRG